MYHITRLIYPVMVTRFVHYKRHSLMEANIIHGCYVPLLARNKTFGVILSTFFNSKPGELDFFLERRLRSSILHWSDGLV